MRYCLLALGLAFALTACKGGGGPGRGTYTPLIRSATFGAPGHLHGGDVELDVDIATGGAYEAGVLAGLAPGLAYAPTDWLALEAGAEIMVETAALGYAGIRFTPVTYESIDRGTAFDFAFGGGSGVGGRLCGNQVNDWYDEHVEPQPRTLDEGPCPSDVQWDDKPYEDRFAIGSYFELGIGYRVNRWLTYFWRPRFQASWAAGVPETLWGSFVFGPHIRIVPGFEIHFSGGPLLYYNDYVDNRYAPFFIGEFGFSIGPGR